MISDIIAQLQEGFDPHDLDNQENLEQLHRLIHIKGTDPGFHRYILDNYGFLTYAFQDAFGFGLPLPESMLHRIGIFENTFYLFLTKGEGAALSYTQDWTASTITFNRWKQAFYTREESILSAYAQGTLHHPSPLEQAILSKRGMSAGNIPQKKKELTATLRALAEESLIDALHLKDTHPALHREIKTYFRRLPSALQEIGITEQYIHDHLIDSGIMERMLKLYLLKRSEELFAIKETYKIHQRNFTCILEDFEERRIHDLRERTDTWISPIHLKEESREGVGTTMSPIEIELDSFLHETLLDEDIYVLHIHHEPYRGMSPTYTGKMTCDFKIGPFWIEVAGGIGSAGFFPLYDEHLAYKRQLAADAGEELIVLETRDFRRQRYKDRLSPVFSFIEREDISAIIPPDLFNFRRERQLPTCLSSEGQHQHFKNQDAWWRKAGYSTG
jgi:hypothetical protein